RLLAQFFLFSKLHPGYSAMKKISLLLLLPAFVVLYSCKSSKKPENSTSSSAPAADTNQNSLDWEGSYTGSLPCADCAGILTQVDLLKGNRYRMESRYLGKPIEPVVKEGSFTWNSQQNK